MKHLAAAAASSVIIEETALAWRIEIKHRGISAANVAKRRHHGAAALGSKAAGSKISAKRIS